MGKLFASYKTYMMYIQSILIKDTTHSLFSYLYLLHFVFEFLVQSGQFFFDSSQFAVNISAFLLLLDF